MKLVSKQEVYYERKDADLYEFRLNVLRNPGSDDFIYNANVTVYNTHNGTQHLLLCHKDFKTYLDALKYLESQNKLLFPEIEGEENGRGID